MVKPGQIVKVKVIDVDLKRQRIALTMRLDDAASRPTASTQPGNNTAGPQRGRGPSTSNQAAQQTQPLSAMAMALAKARQKS